MKKTTIMMLWTLSLSAFPLAAQSTYFNHRYDFFDGAEVGFGAMEINGEYLTLLGVTDTTNAWVGTGILRLTPEGDEIQEKIIFDPQSDYYPGWMGSLTKVPWGGLILGGSYEYDPEIKNGILYRFNDEGDTLWTRQFTSGSWESIAQAKPTPDHGFILVGGSLHQDPGGDFWLIKTDSLGQEQWRNYYGSDTLDWGYSVTVGSDGGFLMAGRTNGFGTNDSGLYDKDILLIKTDSRGVKQWHRTLGGAYGDEPGNVISTADGGYVLCGAKGDTNLTHVGDYLYKHYLVKLDSLGNVEWERTYGERFSKILYSVRELPDGSLVACGHESERGSFHRFGVVLKVAANGDSLWLRRHDNLKGDRSRNSLRDIRLTSDGGFILTGELIAYPPDTFSSPTTLFNQDLWVLKLDSLGCDTPGCAELSTALAPAAPPLVASLFPNPSPGRVQLRSPQAAETDFTLYEAVSGREVHRHHFRHTAELDLSQLPAGLYLYRFASRQGQQSWGRWVKK